MPTGFSGIRHPFFEVNTFGQRENCYFCTVAALNNVSTNQLVGMAEQMQQDGASVDQISNLFRDAGTMDISVRVVATHQEVQEWVMQNIPPGHSVGLAYTRSDQSGHMIVLLRITDTVQCLDYQQAFNGEGAAPRYVPFPPELNIVRYSIFYRHPAVEGPTAMILDD